MLEALIGTTIMILILLFVIDLSLLISCLHRFNYQAKNIARAVSLSRGKKVNEIKSRALTSLVLEFAGEISARRLKGPKIILKNVNGKEVSGNKTIRSGELMELSLNGNFSMNFTPFQLFETFPGIFLYNNIQSIKGLFHYSAVENLIVE